MLNVLTYFKTLVSNNKNNQEKDNEKDNEQVIIETNKTFDLSLIMHKILNPQDNKSNDRKKILDEQFAKIYQISHDINEFCHEPTKFINKIETRECVKHDYFPIQRYSDIVELKLVDCKYVNTVTMLSNNNVLSTIVNDQKNEIDLGYIFSIFQVCSDVRIVIQPNVPECKLIEKCYFLTHDLRRELSINFRYIYKNMIYVHGMVYPRYHDNNPELENDTTSVYKIYCNDVYMYEIYKEYVYLKVYGLRDKNYEKLICYSHLKDEKKAVIAENHDNNDILFEITDIEYYSPGTSYHKQNLKDKERALKLMEWFEKDNSEYPEYPSVPCLI